MKTTPTPSFPVEKQKEKLKAFFDSLSLKKEIEGLTKGIFPDATNADPMRGGIGLFKFLWRPNNYRLKIPFISGSDPKQEIKALGGLFPVEFQSGTATLKVDEKITLMMHPDCVIAIWSLKNKKKEKLWFKVDCDSSADMDSFIDSKVKAIQEALESELKKLKLSLDFNKAIWIRHEDGIKGEEFLDSLKSDLVIHDTYFKKVYTNEAEFKAPAYVKNFIANRSLEKVSPEIVAELSDIKNLLLSKSEKLDSPLRVKNAQPFFSPDFERINYKQELVLRKILKPDSSNEEWLSYLYENREALLSLNLNNI